MEERRRKEAALEGRIEETERLEREEDERRQREMLERARRCERLQAEARMVHERKTKEKGPVTGGRSDLTRWERSK